MNLSHYSKFYDPQNKPTYNSNIEYDGYIVYQSDDEQLSKKIKKQLLGSEYDYECPIDLTILASNEANFVQIFEYLNKTEIMDSRL
jgi:hypothetical protein